MRMRLVTGAAGFLGSHLMDRLLSRGTLLSEPTILLTGDMENLPILRNESRFGFEERDICEAFDRAPSITFLISLVPPARRNIFDPAIETLRVGSMGTV